MRRSFTRAGLTINLTDERVTQDEVAVDEVVSDVAEAPKSAATQPNPLHRTKLRAAPFTIRVAWWTLRNTSTAPRTRIHSSIVDFSGKGTGHRWRSRCMER